MERTVSCLWKEPNAPSSYRTGLSLHSHTNQSQESLSFISDYLLRQPVLRRWFEAKKRKSVRCTATPVDLNNAYWTPPLTPMAAFRLETGQIRNTLSLQNSFVSISDHDTISAPMELRLMLGPRDVPVSVEWTVPFGDAVFHFGVHNLPGSEAEAAMQHFRDFTQAPERRRFSELLRWLHSQRDVLVILNHPYWDLAGIGSERHERMLSTLLAQESECIHALELSGIRSWEENCATRRLAEKFNLMVISGGDRHGTEPNATLNLSNAESFEEFVHEIRREHKGHVLFLPQYRQSNTLRVLQTILSVVREYPDYPSGSQRWDGRVFHPDREGATQPLAALWECPPPYISSFFAVLHLLDFKPVQRTLHTALLQPTSRFAAFDSSPEEVAQ